MTELEATIVAIVQEIADGSSHGVSVELATNLFAFDDSITDSLELDSLDALEIITTVEDRLGVSIDEAQIDFGAIRTVQDLVRLAESVQ